MRQMGKKELPTIAPGFRIGRLTVAEATEERKSGYIVWLCLCDCGGNIRLDTRTLQRGTVRDCGCETTVKPGQKDLTGKRFGKLVCIAPTDRRGPSGGVIWRCQCDCGKECFAPSTQLQQGYKKSCGCLRCSPIKDYVGKRFGKLVVQKYAGKREGVHRWLCLCDCGNQTIVGQTSLQSGKTKSCGCLGNPPAQDILGRRFGDLTVIAYDGSREGTYYWRCRCKCGKETVVRQNNLLLGHTQSCGCRKKTVYIDNLKLVDGTSVAMLEASRSERLIRSNSSGYNGVYKKQKSDKWAAQITFKGKTYYLGSYAEIEDAVKARKTAEERMYGEFLDWYYETYAQEN